MKSFERAGTGTSLCGGCNCTLYECAFCLLKISAACPLHQLACVENHKIMAMKTDPKIDYISCQNKPNFICRLCWQPISFILCRIKFSLELALYIADLISLPLDANLKICKWRLEGNFSNLWKNCVEMIFCNLSAILFKFCQFDCFKLAMLVWAVLAHPLWFDLNVRF